MDRPSVFDFRDYKAYIRASIAAHPGKGRGEKAKLAKAMNAQSAFVSQVLHGSVDISAEQACLANDYFGHAEEEGEYFLLLVQFARAGNARLREHLEKRLAAIEDHRLQIKNRVGEGEELSFEKQAVYYSHWLYSAIHMATSIPALQSREALARYFGLSVSELGDYLEFLLECGLVRDEGGRLACGEGDIFLTKESPFLSRHHANWRLKALQALPAKPNPVDLHYSTVLTLAKKDVEKIRKLLLDAIERTDEVVGPSPEETLFAIGIDAFVVK